MLVVPVRQYREPRHRSQTRIRQPSGVPVLAPTGRRWPDPARAAAARRGKRI